ncbi:MAG TPA: tRNA (N(6)-L-threonylcarbamoyladenosine(37)-C(2))-methylthiotransferase MtaB [Thermosulfurimonas dismutans]|uniref:tRNA (N(6)-L-threonylcarbamoyladenosine(37)-C(2))-methylthiotransferase n=1 Tax=Thermosulfurimonas dismutans TaxID=999894 RepID=A0A7C3H4D7_9BACT|nr:tRNA (N(6)-L-threonylcarbamoyladenosine(37)-C(2))-methylthiotransferase MtaB [Thermosulfurimonas dismutans]
MKKIQSPTFSVLTLGCKVNQVEGAYLRETLEALGGREVALEACPRLVVINTCAVTSRAAYEGRKLLRRALSAGAELVIVTGCYAQIAPEEILRAGQKRPVVLGQAEKFRLGEILDSHPLETLRGEILVSPVESLKKAHPTPLSRFPGHTRAFLRIQDGCDQRCTYCIVPLARGASRSLPEEEVLAQARRFVEAGYRELVLTGIHLGFWGRDLSPPRTLVDLLCQLERLGPVRLRLSSLEVTEITPDLLAWAERSPAFAPHFHIPLQSGDNQILRAMGRPYTAEFYLSVLQEIRERFPHAAIGADVIVGFPGETEEAFRRTYELIAQSPLTYLHVFPFSPRPGTPASRLPRPPAEAVSRRARALRELAQVKKRSFYRSQIGRVLQVLVEEREPRRGLLRGLSENYLPVYLQGNGSLKGQLVKVRILEVNGDRVFGERI